MRNQSAEPLGSDPPGSLASSKFLGTPIDALSETRGLRILGIAGSCALIVGFAIPMAPDYHAQWPWELLGDGPAVALLYPLAAAALGLAAALIRSLSPVARAGLLSAAGLGGLAYCVPELGALAGAPSKLMPVLSIGMVAAGAALIARCVDPRSDSARKTLVAGAVISIIGLLIPMADAYEFLPTELWFSIDPDSLGTATPLGAYAHAFNRDPLVFFSTLYLVLPALLLPVAAVVAWPKPTGPWDQSGLALRPMAALALLYVPIGFGLYLFNMMGLADSSLVYLHGDVITFEELSRKLMLGRAKLLVLGSAFALWAQLGAVVLIRARSGRSRPDEKTRRTASESEMA